jgi:hypothetical protein
MAGQDACPKRPPPLAAMGLQPALRHCLLAQRGIAVVMLWLAFGHDIEQALELR